MTNRREGTFTWRSERPIIIGMNNANKMMDITDYTDAVVDVLLASRTSEAVDCSRLTAKERYMVAEALGWPMDARTRTWIDNSPTHPDARPEYDYEGMILDEQEDFRA